MLILKTEISIGQYIFDFCNEIEVTRSVDELTQSGYITMPKNVVFKKDNAIVKNVVEGPDAIFKRGDLVIIKVGYEPNLNTIFQGYISTISPSYPLRFEVEDTMFRFKQIKAPAINLTKVSLEDLLLAILPAGQPFDALDVNLGNFRIAKPTTVAKVLEYLRDNYGLSVFIREDQYLSAGLAFDLENITTDDAPVFAFGENIIYDTGLEYQRAEDQIIKVQAVSIKPDNTKIEIELGDEDGELRTIFKYNVDEADLRKFATDQLTRLKYEGFSGSFTTFAEPRVTAGQVIEMVSAAFPEKNGFYLVRSVTTKFGAGGGRQDIELDIKIE
jgi:hypothetical protein